MLKHINDPVYTSKTATALYRAHMNAPVVPKETMKGARKTSPVSGTFADFGTIYALDREPRRQRIRVN